MFVPCNDCGSDGGMYLTGWTAAPENRAICNSCASERVFGSPPSPGTVPQDGIPPQSSTANTPVPGTFSVWCERCGAFIRVVAVDQALGHMLEYHPRIVEVLASDWFGGELR